MASEITKGLFGSGISGLETLDKAVRQPPTRASFGGLLQTQRPVQRMSVSSPMAAITQRILQGGEQLQGSIRGMFGQQTPQEARDSSILRDKEIIQKILSQNPINTATSSGLKKLASLVANEAGGQSLAIKLSQQANKLEIDEGINQLKTKKDKLDIKKLELEMQQIGVDKIPKTEAGIIMFIAKLKAATNNYEKATPEQKILGETAENLLRAVQDNNNNAIQKAFDIKLAKETAVKQAKNIPALKTVIENAKKALTLLDEGIVSGGLFPEVRFMGGESLKDILPSEIVDPNKIDRTAEYLSLVGDGVLGAMQQLGGSDSNEELRKMEKMKGAFLGYSKGALKRILENIIVKESKVISDFKSEKRKLGIKEDSLNEKIKMPTNREELINEELRKRGLIK